MGASNSTPMTENLVFMTENLVIHDRKFDPNLTFRWKYLDGNLMKLVVKSSKIRCLRVLRNEFLKEEGGFGISKSFIIENTKKLNKNFHKISIFVALKFTFYHFGS